MDIVLKNLNKSFFDENGSEKVILKNFNLKIPKGSIAKIKGHSGSGKSTLMNIIAGIIEPNKGSVKIGETELTNLNLSSKDRFRAKNIGYIFQTFNLLSPLSVIENIYVPTILTGNIEEGYKEKALKILKDLKLEETANKSPFHLSVGQRQRVAIARSLFTKPQILLADEPTASLDKESSFAVKNALITLNNSGTTVIIATHDTIFDDFEASVIYDFEKGE
jgi:putative ABC transport system ATP-binding protein